MPNNLSPPKRLPKTDLDHALKGVGLLFDRLKDKSLFITGGTGIIGKWLLETLLFADDQLHLNLNIGLLTRNPTRFKNEVPHLANDSRIRIVVGDVTTFELPADKKFSHVIHGATDVVDATDSCALFLTCVDGTKNLLDQALSHGAKRILLLSSGAVYGKTPDNMDLIPESYVGSLGFRSQDVAYGQGKRAAELLCAMAANSSGVTIPVARCFAMVGPYLPLDKHFAIGNFIKSALESKPIVIEGDGSPIRSYLYMADVVARLLVLLLDGESVAYNVGSDSPVSISALADEVRKINLDIEVHVKGKPLHGAHTNRYVPSTELLDRSWQLPKTITLADAIQRTADWYQ